MKKYVPQCLGGWKQCCLLLFANMVAMVAVSQVKVTGKVTDANGNALPGITVTVRATNLGTATAVNGTYTLSVDLKAGSYTIVFSGIGYRNS